MILSERVFDEINQIVVSTLGLSSNAIVTKATKFIRFDWQSLLRYFEESVSNTLQPPYCIIRPGPEQPEDWGMANSCWTIPIEIFFIESERNRVNTTNTFLSGIPTVNLGVASSTGMFVGQRLLLELTGVYVIVASIVSATAITIETATTLQAGEPLTSDISSDVHVKMEKLRTAFKTAGSYTHFQMVHDPEIDVSDMNPANAAEKDNYFLFAGSCFIQPLVGETHVP